MRYILALLETLVLAVILSSTANAKDPPAPQPAPASTPEAPSFPMPHGVEFRGGIGISPTPSCVCPRTDGFIFIDAKSKK